ncbi:SDR family NAD(P)-dependent oxidoreductase [Alloalcanivorax xenomutans]|uniref:SDR family NAD(P)-dependent oxidoreductase n=1 Tax=Alloalcanivorax xenomutans TaxID=1094342 RepID=UPI0024E1BEBE|nr:SDR family oxidoreductase [Alloalcanivorax xenomutans]WOA29815.1 SDR family oxidoreductase [Alloalcanivorax xenomutans]
MSQNSPVMLITGAAHGLGAALARAAVDDYRLALLDRDELAGQTLANTLRGRTGEVLFLHADVSDERAVRQAMERIQRRWERLDVVINNAGVADTGPFEALGNHGWETLWRTNVMGTVYVCRAALALMKRQNSGHLINISALAGITGPPGLSSYAACSGALVRLSEALAAELAGTGIAVSVACPDLFASTLHQRLTGADPLSRARLERAMRRAADDVDTIAREILGATAKRPLYIFPQAEARRAWRRKRRNPVRFFHKWQKRG